MNPGCGPMKQELLGDPGPGSTPLRHGAARGRSRKTPLPDVRGSVDSVRYRAAIASERPSPRATKDIFPARPKLHGKKNDCLRLLKSSGFRLATRSACWG